MRLLSTRILMVSALVMPSMLIAKPAKKAAKPAAQQPTEDLSKAAPTPPPPKAPPPPAYHAAYGMAGCGLGSLAIHEDGMIQILAATLNATGFQTFGISTGTSNCKPNPQATAMEQRVFIESNLATLKREAASGQGETLSAFADLLGCQSAQFSAASKANFQQIYSATEPEAILRGYKAVLPNQCERLI